MYRFVNALGFQAGWWACVASVGFDRQAEALAFCATLVAAHLRHCASPAKEMQLAVLAMAVGIAVDSTLQYFSVIRFLGLSVAGLSPLWLWMLWVLFATTLNSSLGFLQTFSWKVSAAMGLVFGPVSYIAGAKLGAADFDYSTAHISALAVIWMVVLPALVRVARQMQVRTDQATSCDDENGGGVLPEGKRTGNSDPQS